MDEVEVAAHAYREGLSVAESARRLGCHRNRITRAIREGKLRAFLPPDVRPDRPGPIGYKILPADLIAWWTGKKP
jgi:hypothetical protein